MKARNWFENRWFDLRMLCECRTPFKQIGHAWYWFRSHTYTRYHLIDIRDPRHDYSWGWIDRDHAMLMACFTLLRSYVEKEYPFCRIDWNSDDRHKQAAMEIRALYRWWTVDRQREWLAQEKAADDLYIFDLPIGTSFEERRTDRTPEQQARWDSWVDQEDVLEKKDDDMLMRLIQIRRFLWT